MIEKYKTPIIIVILIIANLFLLNTCNRDSNRIIDELTKDNERLQLEKDSIRDVNDKLQEDFVKLDTLVNIKEREIEKMSESIKSTEREVGRLKSERNSLIAERKKILEKKKKIDEEIERLISDNKIKSGDDLIESLKEKLK